MNPKPNSEKKPILKTNSINVKPLQIQSNKQVPSILRNKNYRRNINPNNNKNKNVTIKVDKIPQDTKEDIKQKDKLENGDKNIQKNAKIKSNLIRSCRRYPTQSNKNLPIFNSQTFNNIKSKINQKNINDNNQTERNILKTPAPENNENGFSQKRSTTPKKNTQDLKITPFSLEKETILEPIILTPIEQQISFSEVDQIKSLYESFFIASLPKDEYSFEEDINNNGASISSKNLGQCGHESCTKLPAYKGALIFQFPQKEKNEQNFQISELVTSLCFPFGIKVCFGNYKEEKEELFLPKKPSDFYFVTTNGFNDQNYVYVYNFYLKVDIDKFKSEYKCDPIKSYLNSLIKNNDRNLQNNFEECQNMINSPSVYIPHTACLVSKYPCFKEMRKCIYSILKLRNNEEDLTNFLKNIIYEIPDINTYPNYDLTLNYFIPYSMYPLVLKSKYYNRGLNMDIKQMSILFEYFQIQILLKIFKLMLASQKLLFVVKDSTEYKNLSLVTLALLNILYPFNWKYTYIPLLSINMLKFLQSFLPFIMGIDLNMMEYAKNNYIEKQNNITIIYLRKSRKSYIDVENPDENANIEIPGDLKEMLANDLQTIRKNYLTEQVKEDNILSKLSRLGTSVQSNKNDKSENEVQLGKKIREVFLKFFVEIFGDYQEYTSSIDETACFNSESFLSNVPKEYHNFYLSIFNSEMFHDFLQRNVVINSPLYKPDRYYNKYCIREKKGNDMKKYSFKKRKTFLNDSFVKQSYNNNLKQSPKNEFNNRTYFPKGTLNPRLIGSSKLVIKLDDNKLSEQNTNNSNNEKDSSNNDGFFNSKFTEKDENTLDLNEVQSESEEEEGTKSMNSSFNQDGFKNLVINQTSNKYIVPPYFIKYEEKALENLSVNKIQQSIMKFYGQEKLLKKDEYEKNYILETLPLINYENLSSSKKEDLDCINRYAIPSIIIKEYTKPKRHRSNTLMKSMAKEKLYDPKLLQLEDFMKEILSSSGKNASYILYPQGIKDINNTEDQKKNEESKKESVEEKENGGSQDKPINRINSREMISITDFQNIVIRHHFALLLYQNKDNAYQSNIISSNSYNILTKIIFNVFLYSGNKSIEDFQVCRALTKSLYLYYKKNKNGKKIYLYHGFNKTKPFDIWTDKAFWNYFYERELASNEKNDNNKFNVLIEISSIMNDLHFSANTQVDIIIDTIAKKEISDKELQNVLFKTIIKQFNNRVVVTASMD